MLNTNFLHGVTGNVAEISMANRAIINFELEGVTESAFLKSHRFYIDGKSLSENQNLNQFLKTGQKVKFSCHINDNPNAGQCKWFITNCWRHIESDRNTVVMLTGMMNVAGSVTYLKQRQGTLAMTDLLGNEHKIHFLASKVYLYGKRMSASKPLSSLLQIEDKFYFDAIPCFPEENDQKCNWFATCVHKGKKPENLFYVDYGKTEANDIGKEKHYNAFFGSEKPARSETGSLFDKQNPFGESPSVNYLHQQESLSSSFEPTPSIYATGSGPFDSLVGDNFSSGLFSPRETESAKADVNPKIEFASKLSTKMLDDMKLLTMNPKNVFAKSTGMIMDLINEEYGVILGEFQRNNFQTVLFHRSNAFLFKMNLAHSKLTEIFIEGDRVRFIAVQAPKQFVCDWIATQVSVAANPTKEREEQGGLPDDLNAIEDIYNS